MLDHTKNVLKRVSFDVSLFCKELEKACKVLLPYELEELVLWLSKFIKEKIYSGWELKYFDKAINFRQYQYSLIKNKINH